MRYREITEAPIANIELRGDATAKGATFATGTGFDRTDRKLISSEKGRAKMIRAFQKTPHVFEIIFMNTTAVDGSSERDNENVDDFANRDAGVYDEEVNDVAPKPGVIRFLLLSNLSPLEAKMPLTAWTLAHKIGHAIQDQHMRDIPWSDQPKTEIVSRVARINKALWNISFANAGVKTRENGEGSRSFVYSPFLRRILTMKSARNDKIGTDFEIFAEVVAQYLVTGRIGFDRSYPEAAPYVEELHLAIGDLFEHLKGKILVEY